MSLFAELQRRNVIRMAGLYLVIAWLIMQLTGMLLPLFGVPGWVLHVVTLLLALGFVPALVLSWAFELTPRASSAKAKSRPGSRWRPMPGSAWTG